MQIKTFFNGEWKGVSLVFFCWKIVWFRFILTLRSTAYVVWASFLFTTMVYQTDIFTMSEIQHSSLINLQ